MKGKREVRWGPGGYLARAATDVGQGRRKEVPLAVVVAAGKRSRGSRFRLRFPTPRRTSRSQDWCEEWRREESNGEVGSPWASHVSL